MYQNSCLLSIPLSLILSISPWLSVPPVHAGEPHKQESAPSESPERLVPVPVTPYTRAWIIELGYSLGPKAVPNLSKALGSNEEIIRIAAAMTLSRIGSAAVPALVQALQSEADCVWLLAMKALGRIGSPSVPELTKALRVPDARLRYRAALTLGAVGRAARHLAPELRELLESDTDGNVRWAAGNALWQVESQ